MAQWNRSALVALAAVVAEPAIADGAAEPIPSFYQESGKSPNRDYANQHPAEHIDPFTGKLQWHYVDVFIPGNGGFDLKVQRSYSSQSEAFPAPSVAGVGWTIHFGKVLRSASMLSCDTSQVFRPDKNPVLELPDGSRQIMYIGLDGTSFITTRFWKGACSGDTLSVWSPDGTRYDMTHPGADEGPANRPVRTWYVTRITDRNDNWMSISYVNLGVTTGVATVTTSDGRGLTFGYAGSTLRTISDGSRIWTYGYTASSTMAGQSYLRSVQPPVGESWRYDYDDSAMGAPGAASIRKVTYPTGGTIDYTYAFQDFNSTGPYLPRSTVVRSKRTSEGGVWNFDYRPATRFLDTDWALEANTAPEQFDRTTVTGPDGTKVYSHIGFNSARSGWVYAIGLLTQIRTGSVQVESFGFDPLKISDQENVRPGGMRTSDRGIAAPVSTGRSIKRDNLPHSTVYSGFDAYGNPSQIDESGSERKSTTVTYATDVSRWILHVKKDESSRNTTTGENIGAITRAFDARMNLLSESRYGVGTGFTYTGEGDVDTRTDARGKTSMSSSYKRGTPQLEVQPEGVTIGRVVDDAGNVTSQTDGESKTTGYTYDALNRLTRIVHARGNPVDVRWLPNNRRVTRGGYVEELTFDGFGRTVREEHQGAGDAVYRTTGYDSAGRSVFHSYPSSSIGVTTTLDELGRVSTTSHPSSTGGSVGSTYTYNANLTTVVNERGLTTIFDHRSFGDPDHRDLVAVDPPEIPARLRVKRKSLGPITEVWQNGLTRTYNYDSRYFLTSKVDPEVGATVFGRDEVGNMTSRQVGSAPLATFAYDDRNRLRSSTYVNAPTVTRGYYRDDKLQTVTTPIASRSYVYDGNKNLTAETLTVGSQSFSIGYQYNDNDALDVLTYGSGRTVTYAPDALGRPTQAAPYITAAAYHPSGQTSSLTYANGVRSEVDLNARLWPRSLTIRLPGPTIVESSYGYDENGNVLSVADLYDTQLNRTSQYDGVDRLTNADGPWGQGTFTYSGRGNLLVQRLGDFAMGYVYDNTDKLMSTNGSRAFSFSYDRLGNVVGNGTLGFNYDDASNMRCSKCGQADETAYDYDGLNMRVRSTKNGSATYFAYGLDGKLLWERTPMSNVKEYIYFGGKQVATRQQPISGP